MLGDKPIIENEHVKFAAALINTVRSTFCFEHGVKILMIATASAIKTVNLNIPNKNTIITEAELMEYFETALQRSEEEYIRVFGDKYVKPKTVKDIPQDTKDVIDMLKNFGMKNTGE